MLRSLRLGALAALVLVAGPALAADLDEPPPGPRFGWAPPPPPPHAFRPDEGCRVFVKRRYGPGGEEYVRRVRVCDEGPGFDGPPRWHRHSHWQPDGDGPPPPDRFGPPPPPPPPPPQPREVPERW
ncbi:hypothetical protein [Methylobacterium sp. JK268]